jgi:hypothetical protein
VPRSITARKILSKSTIAIRTNLARPKFRPAMRLQPLTQAHEKENEMSTLAEQLAPHAVKKPQSWRDVMTEKERAKYDAGDYHALNFETGAMDLRHAPRESGRISRDSCLDTLDDDSEIADRGTPTPEQNTQAAEMTRGFEIVGTISIPCVSCGRTLPAKGRAKTLIVSYSDDGADAKAFVLCNGCFDALGVQLSADPFFDSLPPLDQKVWQLVTDGLTGVEIAARLSVNGRRVTQQQVSEAKLRVLRRINENRHSIKYGQRIQ